MSGGLMEIGGPPPAGTALVATDIPATPPISRPRIDMLSVQNFRGFPGVKNPLIALGGNNLLVYGENGSGKSSIFYALDQFFSISAPNAQARRAQLVEQTNIHSGEGLDKTTVTVQFINGGPITWTEASHPVDSASNRSVIAGAYRKAMLDYRALLAVNYKFLGQRIRGSEQELFRIWKEVLAEFPERHIQRRRESIEVRLAAVNAAIDAVLPPLKDETNRLLTALEWQDLEIGEFQFSHLAINWRGARASRKIRGQDIRFTLKQRGKDIENPHHLLNEARQSALALALYLAGRCPTRPS